MFDPPPDNGNQPITFFDPLESRRSKRLVVLAQQKHIGAADAPVSAAMQ
jgi:hypothetical protein